MLDISSAQQRTMKLTIAWTEAVVTLLWVISKMYKLQTCYKYEWANIISLNICIYKNFNYDNSISNNSLIFHIKKYSTGVFLGGGPQGGSGGCTFLESRWCCWVLYVVFMRFHSSEDRKNVIVISFAQVEEEEKLICRWHDSITRSKGLCWVMGVPSGNLLWLACNLGSLQNETKKKNSIKKRLQLNNLKYKHIVEALDFPSMMLCPSSFAVNFTCKTCCRVCLIGINKCQSCKSASLESQFHSSDINFGATIVIFVNIHVLILYLMLCWFFVTRN